jgi:hypothetical protein
MARKGKAGPGDVDFWARTPAEHLAHAEALTRRAEADPEERAQLLVHAAGGFESAGEPERAERSCEAAIADGGSVAGGARAFYAGFLFDAGRADEAYAVIDSARKAGVEDWLEYLAIADTLAAQDDFAAAQRWLTRGLVAQYGSLAEIDLDGLVLDDEGFDLARARQSVRARAGLEPDALDRLADEAATELADVE